jgi:hypothetical protein
MRVAARSPPSSPTTTRMPPVRPALPRLGARPGPPTSMIAGGGTVLADSTRPRALSCVRPAHLPDPPCREEK